ncbi:hypothetical protein ACFE04_017092 [Oxalis oulophora]
MVLLEFGLAIFAITILVTVTQAFAFTVDSVGRYCVRNVLPTRFGPFFIQGVTLITSGALIIYGTRVKQKFICTESLEKKLSFTILLNLLSQVQGLPTILTGRNMIGIAFTGSEVMTVDGYSLSRPLLCIGGIDIKS